MLLTTIQVEEVYTIIISKGIIRPSKSVLKCHKKHIQKAYKRITKYAHKEKRKRYNLYPFWCTFTDIGINQIEEGQIRLTLDVPNEYVLLCNYDKWVEYLDYSENDLSTKFWNRYSNLLFDTGLCNRIQAIIPFIKKEWIVKTEKANS